MREIRKQDIVLIAAFLSAALILSAIFYLRAAGKKAAGSVTARVDGNVVGSYRLSEDGEYEIMTKYGRNLLRIRDGHADMKEADCPDGYCMKQKELTKNGDLLVCLPHHLIVRAEGDASASEPGVDASASEPEVDAVAGRT